MSIRAQAALLLQQHASNKSLEVLSSVVGMFLESKFLTITLRMLFAETLSGYAFLGEMCLNLLFCVFVLMQCSVACFASVKAVMWNLFDDFSCCMLANSLRIRQFEGSCKAPGRD